MSLDPYWPSADERDTFYRSGYLVVPDALTSDQVTELSMAIDRCGHGERGGFYNRVDILGLDDAFLGLIDCAPVLGRICGFLGWNIWVNHTHYNIRPSDAGTESHRGYPYLWHRDGGATSLDLQDQCPMTAIKVGFYLTDLTAPESGQTLLIPGSQDEGGRISRELGANDPPPPEAVPLAVTAGSAVLFQQRVYHSQGSPNRSETTRKTIFAQWAFRWLYPVDTMDLGDLETRVDDPVRRQLLGFDPPRGSGRLSSRYYPDKDDLPLKSRLISEVGIRRLCEVGPAMTRTLTRHLNFDV